MERYRPLAIESKFDITSNAAVAIRATHDCPWARLTMEDDAVLCINPPVGLEQACVTTQSILSQRR